MNRVLQTGRRVGADIAGGTLRIIWSLILWMLLAQSTFVLGFAFAVSADSIEAGVVRLTKTCPSIRESGYPCATCGTTRGLAAMGSLEWRRAWNYNPIACALFGIEAVIWVWALKRCIRRPLHIALPEPS